MFLKLFKKYAVSYDMRCKIKRCFVINKIFFYGANGKITRSCKNVGNVYVLPQQSVADNLYINGTTLGSDVPKLGVTI